MSCIQRGVLDLAKSEDRTVHLNTKAEVYNDTGVEVVVVVGHQFIGDRIYWR